MLSVEVYPSPVTKLSKGSACRLPSWSRSNFDTSIVTVFSFGLVMFRVLALVGLDDACPVHGGAGQALGGAA